MTADEMQKRIEKEQKLIEIAFEKILKLNKEIESRKNLIEYYTVVKQVKTDKIK